MIVSLTSLVAAYESNQDQISRRPYTYFKPNIIWSLFQNTLNSDVNLYESACPLCGKLGQNRCDWKVIRAEEEKLTENRGQRAN